MKLLDTSRSRRDYRRQRQARIQKRQLHVLRAPSRRRKIIEKSFAFSGVSTAPCGRVSLKFYAAQDAALGAALPKKNRPERRPLRFNPGTVRTSSSRSM